MKTVHNVVFDVGRVLINFGYDDLFFMLRSRGAHIIDETDFAQKVDLIPYEHGHLSDDDFLDRLGNLLSDPLPKEDLAVAWNNIFDPIDDMLEFTRKLNQQCQVFMLSNTSHMHWQHLQQFYGLNTLCRDLVASYEIGVMKPDAGIYRACEERFVVRPDNTIFVDDKIDNVKGALACGWQGLHHVSSEETISKLKSLVAFDD
jgi:HAD superfamily hydrolase (TIGR01509 family)